VQVSTVFFLVFTQSDTIRLIFAFGDQDPTENDLVSSDYHGVHRGTVVGPLSATDQRRHNADELNDAAASLIWRLFRAV